MNKDFFKSKKHFLTLTIFLILTLWFAYLKKSIIPVHIMDSYIDTKIPFIKEFVVAYYFWFAYMAIGFVYLGFVSKKHFYKLELFLALGMSISFIIFIVYPNAQFPRPVVKGTDVFSFLVNFIYSHDGTNNVFPSVHVCNAIGVHLALINCQDFKNRKVLKYLSLFGMLSICASTVFIKQHSIIDVLGGTILASIIYTCIYLLPKLILQGKTAASEYQG